MRSALCSSSTGQSVSNQKAGLRAAQHLHLHQPELFGDRLPRLLSAHSCGVGQAHPRSCNLHFHRLPLGLVLLALLHFHRRFHTSQCAHLLLGVSDIPFDPVPLPVLESDAALSVIDATDHMLVLLPDRAPHRHIENRHDR